MKTGKPNLSSYKLRTFTVLGKINSQQTKITEDHNQIREDFNQITEDHNQKTENYNEIQKSKITFLKDFNDISLNSGSEGNTSNNVVKEGEIKNDSKDSFSHFQISSGIKQISSGGIFQTQQLQNKNNTNCITNVLAFFDE